MRNGKRLIAIADDEKEIRDILYLLLTGDGYDVLTAEDGQLLVEQMSPDIDLYILDVSMPHLSGIMAAAEIRKQYSTPIIFLTAYSSESDKVMGFSVGADDYIVKPFSNVELLMRVKAILRRSTAADMPSTPQMPKNQLTFQDLILDLDSQTVIKDGKSISFTYTEFKILELLARNRGRVFSAEDIYSNVWNEQNVVNDNTIAVHVRHIREKIEINPKEPKYLKVVWGIGYKID